MAEGAKARGRKKLPIEKKIIFQNNTNKALKNFEQ
jgi:hypothetical protein